MIRAIDHGIRHREDDCLGSSARVDTFELARRFATKNSSYMYLSVVEKNGSLVVKTNGIRPNEIDSLDRYNLVERS